MANERTVKVALLGEDRTLSKTFNNAESAAARFDRKMQETGEKLRSFGTKMTIGVTLPLALLGKSMFDAASDLNESTTKVQVVFGEMSQSIIDFASKSATALGISKQAALEAAGTFGNLFRAMGIGTPKAADMSTKLVQLASDLASFNNADPAEVLESLRSGLVGEVEPLRKFGVNLSDVRLKAEAVRLGLIRADAITHKLPTTLDAATKAQAAFSLITQDTALAQGDFARTSAGAANQSRILKAKFDDLQAVIGAKLLPYGLQLLGWAEGLIDKFSALSPELQNFAVGAAAIAAAIGPVTTLLGGLLSVVGFLVTPVGLVVAAIVAIGGALLYVSGAWPEFNAKADEAIAAFKEKWPAIRDKVVEVLGNVYDWLVTEGVQKLKDAGGFLSEAARSWVDGLWDGGEGSPGMLTRLNDTFDKFASWVKEKVPGIVDTLKVWGEAALKWISEAGDRLPEEFDKFMVKLDAWVSSGGVEKAIVAGNRLAVALGIGLAKVAFLITMWGMQVSANIAFTMGRVALSVIYHGFSIGQKIVEGLYKAIHDGIANLGGMILSGLKAMAESIAPQASGILGDVIGGALGGFGIPGFAMGGMLPDGWSMVGERGPELVHRAGGSTRVFSHAQTEQKLVDFDGGGSSQPANVTVFVGGQQVEAVVTSSQRYDARGRRQ